MYLVFLYKYLHKYIIHFDRNQVLFRFVTLGAASQSNQYRSNYSQRCTHHFDQQSLTPTSSKPLNAKSEAEKANKMIAYARIRPGTSMEGCFIIPVNNQS